MLKTVEKHHMRGLEKGFFEDICEGELKPFLKLIQNDRTLELEIRENYIYIFYRGGALYKIEPEKNGGYKYVNGHINSIGKELRNGQIFDGGPWGGEMAKDFYYNQKYFDAIPYIKSVMDMHMLSVKPDAGEKEIQQFIVRENNLMNVRASGKKASVSRGTDYFFVGFEYPLSKGHEGRIDLIAIQYDTGSRQKTKSYGKLALVEVKFGTDAFKNNSGIDKHIYDAERFFADKERVSILREEARIVFEQKHALGLIDSIHPIKQVIDSKPEFILFLADATSNGDAVKKALMPYKKPFPEFDLKIAVSSVMGYAMYSNRMLSVEEFL